MSDGLLSVRLAQRREAAALRGVATPRRLRVLSILIAASAIALTLIGAGALVAAEVSVTGVQQRTVPAILGMQRIHAWLSDADRSAANAYLAGGSEVTLPELQYQADVAAASRELQSASEHDPGGADASRRLQAIAALVDQYLGLVQTATVDDRQGLAVGTVYLTAATSLMHQPATGILAQVDSLRGLYASSLDQADRTLQIVQWVLAAYGVVAFFLLALLVLTQRFVRRRFHRRRNPRLLLATLLLLVVSAANAAGAVSAKQSIHEARDQTYARLLDLWDARALLYDANGSESLSLIAHDQTSRASADRAFEAQTTRISGLLAAEELTAAGPEERDLAGRALRLYRTFLTVDARVRSLATSGKAPDAITLALGTDQGQLSFAFADVDWQLGVMIQRLQEQFDASMDTAERIIAATAAAELLALAIVALAFWGLQPRIAEFTFAGSRRPARTWRS